MPSALELQEATLRAAVADLVSRGRRGPASGIFTAIDGGAWLGVSAMTGVLDEHSRVQLGVVVTGVQLMALAMLLVVVLPRHG